jgi:hypothetical protein
MAAGDFQTQQQGGNTHGTEQLNFLHFQQNMTVDTALHSMGASCH